MVVVSRLKVAPFLVQASYVVCNVSSVEFTNLKPVSQESKTIVVPVLNIKVLVLTPGRQLAKWVQSHFAGKVRTLGDLRSSRK